MSKSTTTTKEKLFEKFYVFCKNRFPVCFCIRFEPEPVNREQTVTNKSHIGIVIKKRMSKKNLYFIEFIGFYYKCYDSKNQDVLLTQERLDEMVGTSLQVYNIKESIR